VTVMTRWGRKAAELYRPDYARRYRAHDDGIETTGPYVQFCRWLEMIGGRFSGDIDVLDLGCGTGRYFCALRRARSIVGIDASPAMLAEARTPIRADEIRAASVELVEGDFVAHDFGESRFDLVYSIGVLAEHTPLDARVVANVQRWLRPGGRFAFTTVHPDSSSVPQTLPRATGRLVLPLTGGALRRRLRDRLTAGGLYADDHLIHERLDDAFEIETIDHMESEAHFHCLCVARRRP
jgi:SAM-dependent methyltransferase